uniref:Uncharacterized protein n=1 Tax=Mycena chlorophos TaxID=658473 RepID=A0ABQ0M6U2_MYCCL|nr:predicted protein [Mycena chlorophos]
MQSSLRQLTLWPWSTSSNVVSDAFPSAVVQNSTTGFLSFADVDSYALVPEDESVLLTVNVPPVPELTSGGPGLSDLPFSAGFQEAGSSTRHTRTLAFHVRHSADAFQKRSAPLPPSATNRGIASSFVQWGGFAPPLEPHAEDAQITPLKAVLGLVDVDRPNMRYQLRYWASELEPIPRQPRPRTQEPPIFSPAPKSSRPSASTTSSGNLAWLSPLTPRAEPAKPPPARATAPEPEADPEPEPEVASTRIRGNEQRYRRDARRARKKLQSLIATLSAEEDDALRKVEMTPRSRTIAKPRETRQKKKPEPREEEDEHIRTEVEKREGMAARIRDMFGGESLCLFLSTFNDERAAEAAMVAPMDAATDTTRLEDLHLKGFRAEHDHLVEPAWLAAVLAHLALGCTPMTPRKSSLGSRHVPAEFDPGVNQPESGDERVFFWIVRVEVPLR